MNCPVSPNKQSAFLKQINLQDCIKEKTSCSKSFAQLPEDENGVSSTTMTTLKSYISPMVSSLIAAKCEAEAVNKTDRA
ncbi:uncharacterized protein CELE_F13A2.9 [Caenorhabditis elegans]|uniref:Uncharacterized protein n=1 Tax=Caenorhabditis elegans TaxID=6239 RepID=Q4R141_CAEEL|nr:Uncharacterized protein CELE_F13A2.9 [Caenorhabditis elegans]CCD69369.2 Uncharacterized protein CELE_F13A2.9 [Caenorhabditis elegans]|eukprot:NP_001317746.1 Uncharacterized protein CELE_F13A2.9 [Caenorhabditis elegans]